MAPRRRNVIMCSPTNLDILESFHQGHQEVPEIPARRLIPLLQDPKGKFQLLESL